jgi:hypothetical protein
VKHQEHYRKYKATYPPTLDVFSIIWTIVVAALVEPFLILSKVKPTNVSVHDYLEQLEYFALFAFPVGLLLAYVHWKESIKRHRGYCWIGKFQVKDKKLSRLSCYLTLTPGQEHRLKVDRNLFDKTKVGDFIIVRRDALGVIDEVKRVNNLLGGVDKAKSSSIAL